MNYDWYNVRAFRRPQHEVPATCASRLAQMLQGLEAIHPSLSRWFAAAEKHGDESVPADPISPAEEHLTRLFENGRFQNEGVHRPMPELGYRVSGWNGRTDDCRAHFEVEAGSYAHYRAFPNGVSLQLRKRTAANGSLVTPTVLKSSLLNIAAGWQPEWAALEDQDYWDHIENKETGHLPKVRSGWMIYLSAPYARRIIPPTGAKSELIKGGGLLMIATEELFSVDNPLHVAAADAIQAALAPLQ